VRLFLRAARLEALRRAQKERSMAENTGSDSVAERGSGRAGSKHARGGRAAGKRGRPRVETASDGLNPHSPLIHV